MQLRASLSESWKRIVKVNENDKDKLYINGEGNLYPNETERTISISPTAFRCANLMGKYIEGKGVLGEDGGLIYYKNLPIINSRKNYKITDVISLAAKSIAYQYGVYFHIIYGLDDAGKPKPVGLDVLNYSKVRKTKEDAQQREGMFVYKDFENKKSFGKDDSKKLFYPFNPDPNVILAQIKADSDNEDILEAIKSYRGQIYYLNLNPDQIYSSSLVDSVYNDADSEYRIGVYTNEQTRNGFLGKTIALTQGLDEEDAEEIDKDLQNLLGAENSSNVYYLRVDKTEDLDNVLKIIQLKAQFDDKLFELTEKRLRRNILGAFNNVPEILIMAGDGTLFGTNSDTYQEAKLFYSEQNEYEREQLERALEIMGFPVKIEPIAKREIDAV